MPLAPVDYGPQVQADTQGLQELRQQEAAVFRGVHEIGSVVEGGAGAITQGLLHTQAVKATATVKERQAQTLQFIDSNPYVAKTDLQQRMRPEDYEQWHSTLGADYKDADAVPMYSAAGALFDSEAKKAREEAGQLIALPGWRSKWDATERTESSTIRERYVNRLAADQMIADNRAQTLMAMDKMVDAAVKPEDVEAAAKVAETSPWLKPAERRFAVEKALVAKDSFVARQAMLAGDTEVMTAELNKLRSDKAADFFPNMNVKQRLDLANQLGREYSYKAAKDVAEKQIIAPNVDENGKVDRTAIAKALAAYNGPNKEEVTKAVKTEESEKLGIFNAQMSELQQQVFTAGQNPQTGRFSYARAMRSPEARKAAERLNKDAPGLIAALSREDERWNSIDAKADARERREARQQLIESSQANLEQIHRNLDDPAQSDVFKNMTPQQFDSHLYEQDMTEVDRAKARAAFKDFIKNGGKPDERASTSVRAEIAAAANGNPTKTKELMSKYGDSLLQAAHAFIRANPTLPPDKMTDALRAHLKQEMLSGKVVGTGILGDRFFQESVRRIEWETKADYAGKSLKLKDGTIIQPRTQLIPLTKGGKTFLFPPGNVAAARADGWK